MIQTENLVKRFGDFTALNGITCTIPAGCVYGLVGSNGAGKSTFLRLVNGVYRADQGAVFIDGEPAYENPRVKQRAAYVPDDLYFLPGASLNRMAKLYAAAYPAFDGERYRSLVRTFRLNPAKPLGSFSKGMKRQAAILLALSCRAEYLFFDETFDGLDPVMRNLVKSLICGDVLERGATAIIASHSLRELEDTCDQLALLHQGGIVLESDVQNLKTSLFKIQVAFTREYDRSLFTGFDVLHFSKRGSVSNLIVRGDREQAVAWLRAQQPAILDVLPLTLEEVFTYEMEALGYSFSSEPPGGPANTAEGGQGQ
ncbi:MAG TPA: ABC transporter ATP-binding protein [Firmicutes bacterium]|nr:ABC transporter ATP-binding protein [Bacillota bacterium]